MKGERARVMALQDEEETTAALKDIAELEAALAVEIGRLRSKGAMGSGTGAAAVSPSALLGRPIWWWRAMLVAWAHAPTTRGAHAHELLKGFTCALRDFTDLQLVSYLTTVYPPLRHTA